MVLKENTTPSTPLALSRVCPTVEGILSKTHRSPCPYFVDSGLKHPASGLGRSSEKKSQPIRASDIADKIKLLEEFNSLCCELCYLSITHS